MGENDQPVRWNGDPSNPTRLPEQWGPHGQVTPHQRDAELWRQQYQRTGGMQPYQPNGTPSPGQTPKSYNQLAAQNHQVPANRVEQQLASVQQQLALLTASQAKIARTVNPPLWRKVLNSRPIRWLIAIVVVIVLATWGVPMLIEHLFGAPANNNLALDDPGSPASRNQYPHNPYDVVAYVYNVISENAGIQDICGEYMSPQAQQEFAAVVGAANCAQAIAILHSRVDSSTSYGDPYDPTFRSAAEYPEPTASQSSVTVSSCSAQVSGGPRLGIFTVSRLTASDAVAGQWWITGYTPQPTCPPAPPASSGP